MDINIASLAHDLAQHLFTSTALYAALKEMGKGASSEVGKMLIGSAASKTNALLEKLWPKIKTETAAIKAIEELGQKPDDQQAQSTLKLQLEKLLRDSPDWAEEVAQLWEEARPDIVKNPSVVIKEENPSVVIKDNANIAIGPGGAVISGRDNKIVNKTKIVNKIPTQRISFKEAQKWLETLGQLRCEKQISEKDYLSVLSYALGKQIVADIDPQSIEMTLSECPDLDGRLYWNLSDANINAELSNMVITKKFARVHQILTALRLKLDVVRTALGVRFALIPPGTAQNHSVNDSSFYFAETVLTESDWARIMTGESEPSSNENTLWPRLNLSLNEVKQLLKCANRRLMPHCRWAIPTSDQWMFAVGATETIAHHQQSRILKLNPPASFGVYDLLGVAWQFCSSNKTFDEFVVQGGSRFTTFNSVDEIPLPEPVAGSDLEGEDWGFRPALYF